MLARDASACARACDVVVRARARDIRSRMRERGAGERARVPCCVGIVRGG